MGIFLQKTQTFESGPQSDYFFFKNASLSFSYGRSSNTMMSYTTLRMPCKACNGVWKRIFSKTGKKNPDTCGQGLNMKIFKTEK